MGQERKRLHHPPAKIPRAFLACILPKYTLRIPTNSHQQPTQTNPSTVMLWLWPDSRVWWTHRSPTFLGIMTSWYSISRSERCKYLYGSCAFLFSDRARSRVSDTACLQHALHQQEKKKDPVQNRSDQPFSSNESGPIGGQGEAPLPFSAVSLPLSSPL